MSEKNVGILALGHALPVTVRSNEDPIFARVKSGVRHGGISEADLFVGFGERRVLEPERDPVSLAVEAAERALESAGMTSQQIDRVYGYVSPSEYITPNDLFRVHASLGLDRSCPVIPVASEFSNFLVGLMLAADAVRAGGAERVLVVCAAAWTRAVEFENPHAIGIGDGACAALVGAHDKLVIVDQEFEVHGEEFSTMTLAVRARAAGELAVPTFTITVDGVATFVSKGVEVPPRVVKKLLERRAIPVADVTLITHQPSRRLMQAWADAVQPAEYLDTLEELGNMTLATVGVNLSRAAGELRTGHVVLVCLGTGAHFSAMLLRR